MPPPRLDCANIRVSLLCGPAKAAQQPAVDRRSTSVLRSISSQCHGAGGHVFGADNREVADTVTDSPSRLAPMSLCHWHWPPCSPPLLTLHFPQSAQKLFLYRRLYCGCEWAQERLNGDITCSDCSYSAQLTVIGYTTAHPPRTMRETIRPHSQCWSVAWMDNKSLKPECLYSGHWLAENQSDGRYGIPVNPTKGSVAVSKVSLEWLFSGKLQNTEISVEEARLV